jgi:hypothetical protein
MARINPTFYPETGTWETDDGVIAKSVAALKTKLGRGATIENYYPNGYGFIIRERPKSESIFQQSVDEAVAKVARRHESKTFEPAPLAKVLVPAGDIETRLEPVHLPEDIKRIPELPPEGNTATKIEEVQDSVIPSHSIEVTVEGGIVEEIARAIAPEPQPNAPLAPEPEVLVEPIDVPVFLKKPKSVPKPKVPRKRSQKSKMEHYHRTRALESFSFPRVHWDTQIPVMMKMFHSGKSTKEIAVVIRCSENSVIGKLHRLGYKIAKR